MECVVYGFKHHIDVLNESGLKIKQVFVSDGGAKNPVWRKITADIIGHDVKYITDNPGSSLGAAFIAGISSGIFKSWDEIDKFLSKSEITHADELNHKIYDRYYQLYRKLYITLKPLYEELYNIREES